MGNKLSSFLLYALFASLTLELQLTTGFIRIYAFDIPLMFLAAISTFIVLRSRYIRLPDSFDITALLFFFTVSLSLIFAHNITHSLVQYFDWLRVLVAYFSVKALLINGYLSQHNIKKAATIMLGILLLAGFVQITIGPEVTIISNYFGVIDDFHVTSALTTGNIPRLSGTTAKPIVYGLWLSLLGTFLFTIYLVEDRIFRALTMSAIVLALITLTLSRGVLVSYLLSVGIVFISIFRTARRKNILLATVILGSTIFLLANYQIIDNARQRIVLVQDHARIDMLSRGIDLLTTPKIAVLGGVRP